MSFLLCFAPLGTSTFCLQGTLALPPFSKPDSPIVHQPIMPILFVSYSSPIAYKSPGVLGPVPIPLSSLLTHILFCHRRYFALTSDRNAINGGGLLFSDEQLPSCHSLPLNRPSLYGFIPFWSRLLRPYRQIQVTRRSSSRIPWILFSPSPKKVGVNRLQLPIFVPLYILDVLYFFLHVKGCSC